MKASVHYSFTPCLLLDAGYSPPRALAIATADQMTDWATPSNLGPDYWPAATGLLPGLTQIDEVYGARSLRGDSWNPGWDRCHDYHFGGGQGEYGDEEYRYCALSAIRHPGYSDMQRGRKIHLAQDYASHKGYCGWPDERNRHKGDGRAWWSRIADRVVGRNELLGHWLRPEVDELAVSRAALIQVSHDILAALTGSETTKAPSIALLQAPDDKALVAACREFWRLRTGQDMPEFRPYSPQSEDWRRWCSEVSA